MKVLWLWQSMQPLLAMAALTGSSSLRCVIIPGNGCTGKVAHANWYGWLETTLKAENSFDEVLLPETMPDPVAARRESIWVPYIQEHPRPGRTSESGSRPNYADTF